MKKHTSTPFIRDEHTEKTQAITHLVHHGFAAVANNDSVIELNFVFETNAAARLLVRQKPVERELHIDCQI
jgi:hypothetical protein